VQVILLFPPIFGAVGALFYLGADVTWHWKLIPVALMVLSVVRQFGFAAEVHSFVPLAMQLLVCVWVGIYLQVR
jgi:hypothetical protein